MKKFKNKLITLMKFATVGAGNTLIDFSTFFLLTAVRTPYLLSQIISYTAGMVNSYLFNRSWTFQVKQKINMQEVMRFFLINLAASSTAYCLIYVFRDNFGFSLLISKILATAGGTCINFIGSRFWVFRPSLED